MSHMSLLRYTDSFLAKRLRFVWLFLNQKVCVLKKNDYVTVLPNREGHYSNSNHIFVLKHPFIYSLSFFFFPQKWWIDIENFVFIFLLKKMKNTKYYCFLVHTFSSYITLILIVFSILIFVVQFWKYTITHF